MKCEEAKYNTKRIVISGYRVMNEFLFTLLRVVNIHIIIFAAFCNLFLSFLLSVDLFSYGLD